MDLIDGTWRSLLGRSDCTLLHLENISSKANSDDVVGWNLKE